MYPIDSSSKTLLHDFYIDILNQFVSSACPAYQWSVGVLVI